jgi:hypothetical protein
MPTLEQCSEQIGNLVNEKGFNADLLFFKMIWGILELAEAIDLVKKYGLPEHPDSPDPPLDETHLWKIGEEIVDTVFYCCDAYRLLRKRYPWLPVMDEMFDYKMNKNMNRPKQYDQGWIQGFMKSTIDHMHEEGLLDTFILDILGYANGKKRSTHFESTTD